MRGKNRGMWDAAVGSNAWVTRSFIELMISGSGESNSRGNSYHYLLINALGTWRQMENGGKGKLKLNDKNRHVIDWLLNVNPVMIQKTK
jgi:hypothetical protein